MRNYCDQLGRDHKQIRKSLYGLVILGRDEGEVRSRLRAYASKVQTPVASRINIALRHPAKALSYLRKHIIRRRLPVASCLLYLVKFLRSTAFLHNEARKLDLFSLTSEGMIVLTLKHGKHSYSELRFETGLSDRWLTIKLKELEDRKVLEKDGKWYGLVGNFTVSAYELSLYMISQARCLARELAQLNSVQVIILFGSVPKKEAQEYSDLDMLIVVDEDVESVRERVAMKISDLERRYHLTIEPIILSTEDFLTNIRSHEAGIVYGVAEGFEVLAAKGGRLDRILRERVEEIRKTREYLEEGRIWLKAE